MSTEAGQTAPDTTPPEALQARISKAYAQPSRQAAEERWILENLPMVRRIAHKIMSNLSDNMDIEDLISAGTVGLVRAARAFDATKNAEFKTYAYIRIRGAIVDELRGRSFLPPTVHGRIKQIREAYQKQVAENSRPPSDAELASAAGISQAELYRSLQEARKQHFLSIHGLIESRSTMVPIVPIDKSPSPDDQVEHQELLTRLTKVIQELPERDRLLLLLYYERDLNMKEIARVLSLTESRVSQLHASALFKLSMKLG